MAQLTALYIMFLLADLLVSHPTESNYKVGLHGFLRDSDKESG